MRHLDDDVPFGKLVVVLVLVLLVPAVVVCVSARHPHVTLSRYCTIDMERRYILVVQNLGEAMKKTCKNTRRVTNDDGDATHFGREICVDGILHIGGNKAP